MSVQSTQHRLSLLVKAKRRETGLGVREAAKKASISAATFSRLERGLAATLPDLATLEKLGKWLGMSLNDLLGEKTIRKPMAAPQATTPEFVEVHLRADKNLRPETAKALAEMFKVLYQQATAKASS